MEAEIENFIKVWTMAIVSACYVHIVVSRLPIGFPRLVSVLPVICLYISLPLSLSTFHLAGTAVFYLVWLANFKLLLFSFNQGPLILPSFLPHFVAVTLLPIKPKPDPPRTKTLKPDILRRHRHVKICRFLIKLLVFLTILKLYELRPKLHRKFIMGLYCCHMYLGVELLLVVTTLPVKAIFGLELEKQFNEPYLATSLQDFWGRRWNLMVTGLLRQTVYDPVRSVCKPMVGSRWSMVPANLVTFFVSGLMHEVLFYYLSRRSPTWEVTWFFVLHGICVTCEVYVKKWAGGRWRISRAASGLLTVGFVGMTSGRMFFPEMVRNGLDVKAIEECYVMLRFLKDSFLMLPNSLLCLNLSHSSD